MIFNTQRTQKVRFYLPPLLALLFMAMVISACTFEVQPIEKFSSEDGHLAFTYPAAWDVLEEEYSAGSTAVLVGTDPDMVQQDILPSGEAGVAVMLMPGFVPGPDGTGIPLSAQDVAGLMHDSAMAEQGNVTDLETVQLESGMEAYRFAAPSPEADMEVHILSPADGAIVVVALITASDEADATILAEARSVLESVRFTGDPVEFGERAREALDVVE